MKTKISLLLFAGIAGSLTTSFAAFGAAPFDCGDVNGMIKGTSKTDGLHCNACPAGTNMQYKYEVSFVCGPNSSQVKSCPVVYKCTTNPTGTLRSDNNLPERAVPLSAAERGAGTTQAPNPPAADPVPEPPKVAEIPAKDPAPAPPANPDDAGSAIGFDPNKALTLPKDKKPEYSLSGGTGADTLGQESPPAQDTADGTGGGSPLFDPDQIQKNSYDKVMAERTAEKPSLLNSDGTVRSDGGADTATGTGAPTFDVDQIQNNSYDKVMAERKAEKPSLLNSDGTVKTDGPAATPETPAKKEPLTADQILGKSSRTAAGRGDNSKTERPADRCSNSVGFHGDFGCDTTDNIIEGTELTAMVGQTVGSAAVGAIGAQQANKAAKDGKMSSSMSAAAKTQKTAANLQMTMGAASALAGGYIYSRGKDHAKNQAALKTIKGEAGSIQYDPVQEETYRFAGSADQNVQNAFDRFDNLDKGNVTAEGVRANQNNFRANAQAALEEQAATAKKAKVSGVKNMIAGAQQLLLGGFNLAAAKNMKDAAKKLNNADQIQVPTFNFNGDEFVPRQAHTVSGSGGNPDQQAAEEDDNVATADPDLGDPFGGPFDGKPENPGPAADPFKSASIPPTQGSGGGGGGGGSTGVSGSGGEGESAARMADSEKVQYQGAGGVPTTGGRGGGKGSDGPDLSSLFAQLLPKSEEEEKMDQSILDFGGGRGPASESSILGRDSKSLFTRISEVNSDKFKRGHLR